MRRVRAFSCAVVASVFACSVSHAQNLIANSGFDTDLAGWNYVETEIWTSDDARGQSNSGSAQITATGPATVMDGIAACVPVVAGESYSFGATVKLLATDGADGNARVGIIWSSDANCGTFLAEQPDSPFVGEGNDWTRLEGIATAPPAAAATNLLLEARKISGEASLAVTVRFDDATLSLVICGDPTGAASVLSNSLGAAAVTASDALFILRASVGLESCNACICDVNASGGTNATDALTALQFAVGLVAQLTCPSCS